MGGTANAKRSRNRQKMKEENKKKKADAARTAANTKQNAGVSEPASNFSTPPPSLRRMGEDTPDELISASGRRRSVSQNILLLAGREVPSPFIDGDLFQQEVQVRSNRVRNPMEPLNRIKANISRRVLNQRDLDPARFDDSSSKGGSDYAPTTIRKQYKVTTARKPKTLMGRLLCSVNPDDFSYRPSGFATSYINWTFRSGFAIVFLSFVVIFLLLVFIFGLFLAWAGTKNPQCIVVAGDEFGLNAGTELWDGFALSWTTFTTVGYGAVYTATGNDHVEQGSCAVIAILCTAESFIGLLYAGICTAIMFGKIGRIQSHAQVTFSDAMCVEYGKLEGAPETTKSASIVRSASSPIGESDRSLGPYESADVKEGGETKFVKKLSAPENNLGVLGMTINEESDNDDDDYSNHYDENSMMNNSNSGHLSMNDLENAVIQPPQATKSLEPKKIICPVLRFQLVNELANTAGGEIIDANLNFMVRKEKESYPYEPIARFLRVELEESSHPFFNRVWHGRHKLDGKSPLVSVQARGMINNNEGYWPEELNNPESVREHLRFSSVIITMTGISNVSAESVQISKRYYHHDVVIGYNFAPLLFKSEGSDRLKVDMSLVNDVVEQESTTAEYLSENELDRPSLRSHPTDKNWNMSNSSSRHRRSSH